VHTPDAARSALYREARERLEAATARLFEGAGDAA
jgi:hypothetical protein